MPTNSLLPKLSPTLSPIKKNDLTEFCYFYNCKCIYMGGYAAWLNSTGRKVGCSRLYNKSMTIVNDDSTAINKLEASLIDDSRVVIYDHHMFIVQATGVGMSSSTLIILKNYASNIILKCPSLWSLANIFSIGLKLNLFNFHF